MGHPSRNLEDNSAEGDVDHAGQVQEDSGGRNIAGSSRNHYILGKNVAYFYSGLKICLRLNEEF